MKIKVSIIVPVYNSEKYLQDCLRLLINQTLKEIEIICVDDCSTDGSVKILGSAIAQYPGKVKAFKLKKNSGPGAARNLGVSMAKGEYIGFVDSDDKVNIKMYEILYNKAKEENADVVDCAYYNEQRKKSFLTVSEELAGEFDKDKRNRLAVKVGYIVSKIIKKSLIRDNKITFRENVIYEDLDYLFLIYMHAKKIASVNNVLYFYTNNESSASRKLYFQKVYRAIKELIIALNERGAVTLKFFAMKPAVEYLSLDHYIMLVENLMYMDFRKIDINVKKLLDEMRRLVDKYIPSPDFENNIFLRDHFISEKKELFKISSNTDDLIQLNNDIFTGKKENFIVKYRDEIRKRVFNEE